MESWIEQLLPIINEYKDGDSTPLDGDDVDALCNIIKAKINLHEGNINEDEYNQILDKPTPKPTPKPLYKVRVIETGEIQEWSLDAILDEINRDRSGSWTDYDETDWLEGWLEWVDGEFYELLFPCKISIHDGGSDYDWEHFLNYTDAYTRFVQLQGNGNDIHLYELDSNNEYEVKNSSK